MVVNHDIKIKKLEDLIGMNIFEYAEYKGIDFKYTNILKNIMEDDIKDRLQSNWYRKDKRTELEYGKELVISYLEQCFLIDYFNLLHNRSYIPDGCDKEEIIKYDQITNDPDLKTEKGIKIEIVTDWTGYWLKHKKLHLRDSKFEHLLELSKKEKVYLLLIELADPYNFMYQFIEVNDKLQATRKYLPQFQKEGCEIILDQNNWKKFRRVQNYEYYHDIDLYEIKMAAS